MRLYIRTNTEFQSTLPVRGATRLAIRERWLREHFNPRSPCGERHDSIALPSATGTFQSTLPVRGATRGRVCGQWMKSISIHAPRAGSDPMRTP